jgi:hypothetical protein
MTDLLKFEDMKEGMILVSPWGTEVEVVETGWGGLTVSRINATDINLMMPRKEFLTYFGGWKVKDE